MINCELNEIYKEAKLDQEDIDLMPAYIEGSVDFYDTPAYEKLFSYFAFETCEMPYGTAKARTGDPDLWILDKLDGLID